MGNRPAAIFDCWYYKSSDVHSLETSVVITRKVEIDMRNWNMFRNSFTKKQLLRVPDMFLQHSRHEVLV